MADIGSIARDLYGAAPGEFVAIRSEHAARATADGDPALARAIKALRKPSSSAWMVNLLARQRPDLVDEALDLGDRLREAQAAGDLIMLRALEHDRRRLLARVASEASAVAAGLGHVAGPAAMTGLDDTLRAAMADAAAGAAVQSGLLVAGLSAAGFGTVDLTDAVALPHLPSPPARRSTTSLTSARRLASARKAHSAAEQEASAAAERARERRRQRDVLALRIADDDVQRADLTNQLTSLERRLTRDRDALTRLDAGIAEADEKESSTTRALKAAEERLRDAQS